jgi:hypothetical protein
MLRKREKLLASTVNRTPILRLSRRKLKKNTDPLTIVVTGTGTHSFAAAFDTDFSSHIRSSPLAVPVHTLQSLIYTSPLSLRYSFLTVDSWWLSYCYWWFLEMWESQMSINIVSNFILSWLGKYPGYVDFRTERCWTLGQRTLKPIKPGLSRENWDEWGHN